MIRIAICDDQADDAQKLYTAVLQFSKAQSVPIHVECFSDGRILLQSARHFDLFLLDVEMTQMSGIELALAIRQQDSFVPIVYVTSYPDYWRHAYQVHAFDFVEKPFDAARITKTLQDFLQIAPVQNQIMITLQTESGSIRQRVDEICYFLCSENRRVVLHTTHSQFMVKDSLSAIFAQLDHTQFDMPHRCCIVNFRYVQNIVNYYDITMTDGEFLPLAQKRRQEFRKKLNQFMQNQ